MANQMPEMPVVADRKYKDRVFRAVFKEKKDLLELYNALRGSDYTNPEDLEINTLENAVYKIGRASCRERVSSPV